MMMPPQQQQPSQQRSQNAPFGRSRTQTQNDIPTQLPGLNRNTTAGTRERARARTSVKLTQLLAQESRSRGPSAQGPGQDLVRLDSSNSLVTESKRGGRGKSPTNSNRQPSLLGPTDLLQPSSHLSGHSSFALSGHSSFAASGHSSIVAANFYGTRRSKESLDDFEDSQASFFYDPFADAAEQQKRQQAAAPPRSSPAMGASSHHNQRALPRGASKRMERLESRKTLEELASMAQNQDATINEENFEMEIAPGYYVPFRNANEVWRAVERKCVLECMCLECGIQLVCVADCEHVVCPDCSMVNPVFDRPPIKSTPYGAGMGLKKEWITNGGGRR